MKNPSETRTSLLVALHDPDNTVAWEKFVRQYGPMIYGWCSFWGLQKADAEDVTQALLLKLFQTMRQFEYDASKGSFRAWLKTVTRNAIQDHRKRKRIPLADQSDFWKQLDAKPAVEDFAKRMEEAYDFELLEIAKECVAKRVASHTWRAFELMEQGHRSAKEVGQETGLSVAMVYVAKSKVVRMLKGEIARLESDASGEMTEASESANSSVLTGSTKRKVLGKQDESSES